MDILQFIEAKENLLGKPEMCVNADKLIRGIPDLIGCFKVDFMRAMKNHEHLPYHATVVVAPILTESNDIYCNHSEVVCRLPELQNLELALSRYVAEQYSELPPPAPRYSVKRWFKSIGDNSFFFIHMGQVYYGSILGCRGYQNKVERVDGVSKIHSKALTAKAAKEIVKVVCSHLPTIANLCNFPQIKTQKIVDIKSIAQTYLAKDSGFAAMSASYESEISRIELEISELKKMRQELGIEYGEKTRRALYKQIDLMMEDMDNNKEQVDALCGHLNRTPANIWAF